MNHQLPVPAKLGRPAKPTKLTIGTAVNQDSIGLYFTLQALRMYHAEVMPHVEILVIDNAPDTPHGKYTQDIVSKAPNGRYVPYTEKTSTSVREQVFRQAKHEYVMCLDAHVLIRPGAVRQLLSYYAENPHTNDLIQGPLWYDELGETSVATHFKPTWGAHMYGQWAAEAAGVPLDNPPLEIPMQGLGLFSCRKEAWPGFNEKFQGFGGEEGYIHEKFRQLGGKCLCLPFLRWVHCFYRVGSAPYPVTVEDRFWNYLVGWRELGLDWAPILQHFRGALSTETMLQLQKKAMAQQPLGPIAGRLPVAAEGAATDLLSDQLLNILIGLPAGDRKTAMTSLKTTSPDAFEAVQRKLQQMVHDAMGG